MTLSELPEPLRSQVSAMMAQRDLETERWRADRLLEDSNKLYELRGWLRLCDDDSAGHAEFYQWACHYIFGDEQPKEDRVAHLCKQCGVEVFTNDSGQIWWDGDTGLTECAYGPLPNHLT